MDWTSYDPLREAFAAQLAAYQRTWRAQNATNEDLTRFLVNAPVPPSPPAVPVYVKTMRLLQNMVDTLANHPTMVSNNQNRLCTNPTVPSKIYAMWDYWTKSLCLLSQVHYEIYNFSHWLVRVVKRLFAGIDMMKYTPHTLDEWYAPDNPQAYVVVDFGPEVMTIIDELNSMREEIQFGRESLDDIFPDTPVDLEDFEDLSIEPDS